MKIQQRRYWDYWRTNPSTGFGQFKKPGQSYTLSVDDITACNGTHFAGTVMTSPDCVTGGLTNYQQDEWEDLDPDDPPAYYQKTGENLLYDRGSLELLGWGFRSYDEEEDISYFAIDIRCYRYEIFYYAIKNIPSTVGLISPLLLLLFPLFSVGAPATGRKQKS